MKPNRLIFALSLCLMLQALSYGQTRRTIREIQTPMDLSSCNDSSIYVNKAVKVRGVVITDPKVAGNPNMVGAAQCGRDLYIQNGTGPYSGLLIRQSKGDKLGGDSLSGILSLTIGDSVEFTGIIREKAFFYGSMTSTAPFHEFNGETHLDQFPDVPVILITSGNAVKGPTEIPISDVSDANLNNLPLTGEKWEGVFVEIKKAFVTDRPSSTSGTSNMPSICPAPNGSRRRRFTITDAIGNKMVVGDRFLAGRLSSPSTPNNSPGATGNSEVGVVGGTLIYPESGSFLNSVKGIISHWKNTGGSCAAMTTTTPIFLSTASGHGYALQPFETAHYRYGRPLPIIANIAPAANPVTGSATTVNASVTQAPASSPTITLTTVELLYTTALASVINPTFTSVVMTNTSGSNYTGSIPAQAEGTFIRYYIKANNSDVNSISVPAASQANFMTVRNGGVTTIEDVQFSPYPSANSRFGGLNGTIGTQSITVAGVVTANDSSMGNSGVGVTYIQQRGLKAWAGIQCLPEGPTSPTVAIMARQLKIGDSVVVTGKVQESFSFTIILVSSITKVGPVAPIKPIRTVANKYKNSDFEEVEGMLVSLVNEPFTRLKVLPRVRNDANKMFRVGDNLAVPSNNAQILTGRVDSRSNVSTFASLNVSYISEGFCQSGSNCQLRAGLPTVDSVKANVTAFDSIVGVVMYNFSNQMIVPRSNADVYGFGTITALSNQERIEKTVFSLYPNPSTGKVSIALDGKGTWTITSLDGQLKATGTIVENAEMDLGSLSKGIYVIKVQTVDNKVQVRKLILY